MVSREAKVRNIEHVDGLSITMQIPHVGIREDLCRLTRPSRPKSFQTDLWVDGRG
jgi:hypothetical protein